MDPLVPELVSAARLRLRRPTPSDAPEVFARYAGDRAVTRWLAWPRHRSVADSLAFVEWSERAWSTHGAADPEFTASRRRTDLAMSERSPRRRAESGQPM